MAQLRVSYQDPDGRGYYYPFFINFIVSLSDNVSYPWFAPAGTRRGVISNTEVAKVLRGKELYLTLDEVLLSEYGANMIKTEPGIMYVEFPDERDITMFLLRWS